MDQERISRIERCRSCGDTGIRSFFDLGEQPFANSLLRSPDADERRYPLELTFCPNCGLVQLTYTADPEALFSHYIWVTGTSSAVRSRADRFCEEALAHLQGGRPESYVLEIASNDGTFLKPFMARGIEVLGVDPAANVVEEANAEGVPTRVAFFGERVAREVARDRGRPDLVMARNVLAHVANLHDFVEGISYLVADQGLAAIEFHYGKMIQEGLQYDSIYHEHLCYFTAQSAAVLLERSGLEIVDIGESPISGGALVMYARRAGSARTDTARRYLDNEKAAGTNDLESWRAFAEGARQHREALLEIVDAELARGRRVVGYGASARSSTLLNFCGIDRRRLDMIADRNPMKSGLFTAGTRIPIHPPERVMETNPDTILVLAWNFLDEITGILRDRFGFNGHLIVPLPDLPTLKNIS